MNLQSKIFNILSEELEITAEKISLSAPFGSLENMDSMTQVSITNKIEEEMEIEFDFDDLFDIETVEDLVEIVINKVQ
jgi:acyl carrier protein